MQSGNGDGPDDDEHEAGASAELAGDDELAGEDDLPGDAADLASDDADLAGDDADLAGGGVEHRFTVEPARAGERVDALIAAVVPALSRAAVQRLIGDARVTINAAIAAKPGHRVRAGDAIAVVVPPPEPLELVAEDIPLVVLHEDADLIAIDKPAGCVVHPAAGHARGTLVNALLFHCKDLSGIGGALRPGIVHRLDKDTSGVLVATKNDRAHAALSAAFAAKSRGEPGGIVREYLGIAAPPPPHAGGTLRTLHARHPTDRKRFSSRVTGGKPAVTHWTVVEPLPGAALVRFRLETGRTHQIRVHAADHGWPLLADPLYGRTPRPLAAIAAQLGRQALHATLLELDHPTTGARMRFESPLPDDMARTLDQLRVRASGPGSP
jgi:23S rRNA pseudouridine1911/1915/1917 synthase